MVPPLPPTALSPASSRATSMARSIPSETNVNGASWRGQPSGTVWVTTTTGLPIGGLPPHPLVESKSLRPTTRAPVMSLTWRRC